MPSAEAQRTLVKSPPELWAELSDPVSLARHLGNIGEIHIARIEPETKVEWEAESANGTVELKPSGWGTKVTLTIARDAPEPLIAKPEPEAVAQPEPSIEPGPEAAMGPRPQVEPEPEAAMGPQPQVEPEPEAAAEPEPQVEADPEVAVEPESEPKHPHRWWAKLFRRRRLAQVTIMPDPESEGALKPMAEQAPEPEPKAEAASTPETAPMPAAEQQPKSEPEESPDLAAELAAELARLEETMAAQDAELLSAVLDRLGAAHHRPFSRG